MDGAVDRAVGARHEARLSRERAEWTRRLARRERERAQRLRDECWEAFALQTLEDVGQLLDDGDLIELFDGHRPRLTLIRGG